MIGLAGSLLVFTGFWHALEWAMGGRNRDTWRLVPVGLIYIALGWLLVTLQFLPYVAWVALLVTTAGMTGAFVMRHAIQVRTWVIWSFIGIDAVIVAALIAGLAG